MSSEIFINSNPREIRVALMENNQLVELFIEHKENKGIVGNIYKGRVTKVLPGMQVAFVDIGLEKAGFLYVGDIDLLDLVDLEDVEGNRLPMKDDKDPENVDKPLRPASPPYPIQDLLKEGQEIIVQVAKNPLGTKGARITTYISLPGRYLVYMPTVNHINISRRIEDESEKERLKNLIAEIGRPEGGYIVRTAAQGCQKPDFEPDFNFLHRLWENVKIKSEDSDAFQVLYEDLNLISRSIRDLCGQEETRVVIDSQEDFQKCRDLCSIYLPHLVDKIEYHDSATPIFDHYGIEIEIDRALDRKVWLKSGGYISIDQTEALVAIDVNTGKFVGHSDPEETILKTNLEAVREVVYQLRLRNIGGIIIVDFIDMAEEESKEIVWNTLTQALKSDRSRTRILKISELGLAEMTRKRVRESLVQTLCIPCFYCEGKGHIKSPVSIRYEIIREIKRMVGKEPEKNVINIEVHPVIYDQIFEEEGHCIEEIEETHQVEILFQINPKLHQEMFQINIS